MHINMIPIITITTIITIITMIIITYQKHKPYYLNYNYNLVGG